MNSALKTSALLLGWISLLVAGGAAAAEDAPSGEVSARKYPFPLAPRAAIERFAEMRLGDAPVVRPEEWSVLEAAWAARDASDAEKLKPEHERLVVDAMLTASGAMTEATRAAYREKLKQVVDGARSAVADRKADVHPGDALLRYLHAGVMKEGYEAEQTSLTAVFDTGKYNCVSSTAMYYVVGHELGLKLRLISIPGSWILSGHACVDLLDGDKTFELEPTNPDGFDWTTKLKQPGTFTIGYQPNRNDGHTIDGLALAASIYSNRGVAANHAEGKDGPDRLAAASLGLRALMCAPYDGSPAHNFTAVFTNWGPALAEAGHYEEGLRALAFGVAVTGADGVRHNRFVTYSDWLADLVKNGRDGEVQAATEQAAAAFPDDADFRNSKPWYRYAERLFQSDEPAALAVVERALVAVPEADRAALKKFRVELYARWSQWLLGEGRVDEALAKLITARDFATDGDELGNRVGYHVQESLDKLAKDGADPAAAVAHYQAVAAAFPKDEACAAAGFANARRMLTTLVKGQKFDDALAAVKIYEPIAGTKPRSDELTAHLYEQWSDLLAEQGKPQAAVEKCLEGLKLVPGHDRLYRSAVIVIDNWADASMKAEDWTAAIAVYDRGLGYLPDSDHLKHNREYCVSKQSETK